MTATDPVLAAGMAVINAADLVEIGMANKVGFIPSRDGRKRSRTEIWRMHTRGRVNAAGQRIVLKVVREGRTTFTTREWINEYFSSFVHHNVPPTPRERRRRSHANTHVTPQMTPEAAATLRRHGLAAAAGIDPTPPPKRARDPKAVKP